MPKFIILFNNVWKVEAENMEDAKRKLDSPVDCGIKILYSKVQLIEDTYDNEEIQRNSNATI